MKKKPEVKAGNKPEDRSGANLPPNPRIWELSPEDAIKELRAQLHEAKHEIQRLRANTVPGPFGARLATEHSWKRMVDYATERMRDPVDNGHALNLAGVWAQLVPNLLDVSVRGGTVAVFDHLHAAMSSKLVKRAVLTSEGDDEWTLSVEFKS